MAEKDSMPTSPRFQDLTGQRFNRLLVLAYAGKRGRQVMWRCQCDCGNKKDIRAATLKYGSTKSCGCLRVDAAYRHGGSYSDEYRSWQHMKDRCTNKHADKYADYGGRGITCCDAWLHSFAQFYHDVGKRPTPLHTLERINNELGYFPDNVRWATRQEQCQNTRRNRHLAFHGETLCIDEWQRRLGMKRGTLNSRLNKLGWSIERALTKPVGGRQARGRQAPELQR